MIPKTFYITYKEYNNIVDSRIESIKKHNPNHNVYFYDDIACNEFFAREFPPDYQNTFKKIKHGAHKADFFRYCIIYKYGGYYIDMDNIIKTDVSDITNNCSMVTCLITGRAKQYRNDNLYSGKHIHQGLLASAPKSKIIQKLIEHMIQNPKPVETSYAPLAYHMYVRYFYKLLLDHTNNTQLYVNSTYNIGNESVYLIDAQDTSIMLRGVHVPWKRNYNV